ncbi:N-methyl-L-tryptophan oxidase [Paludisphaera borealis]|uniref:Monomeric sarcosine oxidase n=1 Tax=Paludisphaera borealis TaxID=1387353 RepID=A0A1U7CPT1_9BACT|nr:N-methyl-L-tryptophan oxidase [Paludisphaera borealis]APW60883.1 Monomeric sarcosine oxidase [Paludisphaera borealis]
MQNLAVKNVIIGAGAMGAAAAYHLARRGEEVWLVEQFALGHARGSSHGAARIIRHSYADPDYARLMPLAYRAWRELEADAALPLFIRTGGVSFNPSSVSYVEQVAENLQALDVPHRRMSGKLWNEANPAFGLPADYDVVFEPDAGMLTASKAVATQIELASRLSPKTRVLPETPVRRIDLDGSRPVVVTDDLTIEAERLIVAAGSWVGRLLPDLALPVRPTRQQVLYFRPGDRAPFEIARFPVFIYMGESPDQAFYGMPDFQGLGVKVARHGGPDADPDNPDPEVGEAYRDLVRDFLRAHIPALGSADIGLTEVCLYTIAPGERFLVDFHPARSDVLIASPCSGHGFKFSCLIGRVLADLAANGATDVPIDAWKRV